VKKSTAFGIYIKMDGFDGRGWGAVSAWKHSYLIVCFPALNAISPIGKIAGAIGPQHEGNQLSNVQLTVKQTADGVRM
jgi:hypothetical protein